MVGHLPQLTYLSNVDYSIDVGLTGLASLYNIKGVFATEE